jgi:basic membrane lipoprotein Med (substrate-binding protein (PBP1-ABC) superfamily)
MAPHGWLVGQIWTWGPLYVKTANLVLSNKWKAENAMYSMKDGYVGISQFGTAVPLSVRKEAKSIQQSLENDSFYVFKGPMKDRSGVLRIPSGKILDSSEIRSIDWLVPGVEGNLAKK